MTFGKYKGVDTDEVPVQYLDWAIKNLRDVDSELLLAMLFSWQKRQDELMTHQDYLDDLNTYGGQEWWKD
jgi:hypothetical protein